MTSSIESDPTINRLPSPAAMDGITDLSYIHCSSNIDSTTSTTTNGTHDNNTDNNNKRVLLASSSWDGCIRIHDTTDISNGNDKAKLVALNNMESGPLLSIDAYTTTATSESDSSGSVNNSDSNEAFIITGGLDGSIKRFVVSSSQIQSIGSHYLLTKSTSTTNNNNDGSNGDGDDHLESSACSCVKALSHHHVASAGWDSMFYIWKCHNDGTTNTDNNDRAPPLVQLKLPDKAFSMDAVPIHNNSNSNSNINNDAESYRIAISTAGKRLLIIDIQNLHTSAPTATIVLNRESSLKYQSRTCRFFPSGNGLAIGSIEGRVAIEFLNDAPLNIPSPSSGTMKKYAFKCHRSGDIVYPVNAIAFHPKFETFATGGCDGTVVTWDGLHKKKLTVLPEFETSIAALAFNHDGSQLAIASSYTFEEGVRDGDGNRSGSGSGDENGKKVKDDIYIKLIEEKDVMPKSFK